MSDLYKDIIAVTVVTIVAVVAGVFFLQAMHNIDTSIDNIVIPELKAEVH